MVETDVLAYKDFDKVLSFEYGRHDRKSKPPGISRHCLKQNAPLKGTASQKWCLLRLLPQLFADNIPEGNDFWELYLVLSEIVDIVVAPKVSRSSVAYVQLRTSISRFFLREHVTSGTLQKLLYTGTS